MGSCTRMGVRADASLPGDFEIRPPEVLFAKKGQEPKLDGSLDIYAFGLALWEAYDPDAVGEFRAAQFNAKGLRKDLPEFKKAIRSFWIPWRLLLIR